MENDYGEKTMVAQLDADEITKQLQLPNEPLKNPSKPPFKKKKKCVTDSSIMKKILCSGRVYTTHLPSHYIHF